MYALKNQPEDFIVIEDLKVSFSGVGEHLWLYIEKQNLTTDLVRSLLSRVFSVPVQQINYAGKKDKHGVARQWFSLQLPGYAEKSCLDAIDTLTAYQKSNALYEGERLEILQAQVHSKKCQRGCHQGNFFEIKVETDRHFTKESLADSLRRVKHNGFPNYFGEQRFGGNIQSIDDVNKALSGVHRKAKRSRLKPKEAWACSQARAFLFNKVVDARLQSTCPQDSNSNSNSNNRSNSHTQESQSMDNTRVMQKLSCVVEGDLMNLQGSRSCFLVEQIGQQEHEALQQRCNEGDIVPTGPLFGDQRGQLQPQGSIFYLEHAVLSLLVPEAQAQLEKLQESSRRPLVVRPKNMMCQTYNGGLEFRFWLPKGAYATECVQHFFTCLGCGANSDVRHDLLGI